MNERPLLSKLFFGDGVKSDRLVLVANQEINDASWGAWFSEIQQALRKGLWGDRNFTHCHIDFRKCEWADPLPLLSLSISLSEFEQRGGTVSMEFSPQPTREQLWNQRYSNHSRLLKFMANEGFLGLLWKPDIESITGQPVNGKSQERELLIGNQQLTSQMLIDLRELPVSLAFERSTCLPATLVSIRAPEDDDDRAPFDAIDQWAERKLLEVIDPVVMDMTPGWAQRGLRYRLLMLIRECLHNVAEHAYSHSGLAAAYVRYREGALGESPETWARLRPHISREYVSWRVPLMGTHTRTEAFPETRSGFFELFVVDSGIGLCRSLGDCPKKNASDPVNRCMREVFVDGRSRKDPDRPTRFGGLYLVRQLLGSQHDYVRIRDEDTWWGAMLPLPVTKKGGVRPPGQFTAKADGKRHVGNNVLGLAWTVRLSWLEPTDDPDQGVGWYGLDTEVGINNLLNVFRETENSQDSIQGLPVYDQRFSQQWWNNLNTFRDGNQRALLLLPQPDQMKNHIQEDLAEILRFEALIKGGTVVIGDIASEEAATYVAALERARKLKDSPFELVHKIVLVTRHLRVAVLIRNQAGLFTADESAATSFIQAPATTSESPEHSLTDYFRILRLHDSRRLWNTVKSMPDVYLQEPVYWDETTVLDGFLDFPQSLTHPVCRDIYSITLQRLMGLFPHQNCEVTALDSLVDSLIVRFNATRSPRRYSKKQTIPQSERDERLIQIGSVQVTGLTERSEQRNNANVFHFFRHCSGTASGYYLLSWISPPGQRSLLGSKDLPSNAYRRVGRTPVIARGGWKAFPVPRFDKDEKCIYEQCPRDSYRAWQEPSRTPMKVGHWSYGGHHDLLTVNLLFAFDTELDRISLALGGSLARFIYFNLFRIFGLNEQHLNQNGCEIYKAIQKDHQRRPYRHLFDEKLATRSPILVYPSHPVTDHAVDRFLALISDPNVEYIRKRIHAILPIRRHRSGSGLQTSGLAQDRLRAIVPTSRRKKPPPAIFFDDALISGRTYEEIKRLLHSLGFQDIYSLIMLDRQRLPSADHVDGERHLCYWRLDVPTMGSQAHCPLCHAIQQAKHYRDSITSDVHRQRIDSWIRLWSEVNPATQWGDNGLRPIALSLRKYERRFGLKLADDGTGNFIQIGGEAQKIRISNSAGLIAWNAELHALTSRDDLPLRELKHDPHESESLPAEARIQLIASHLLMFFGELDQNLAQELGEELIQALWDTKEHDRHTALAVLTLLGCGRSYLRKVLQNFFTHNTHLELKDRNGDVILLMAIAILKNTVNDHPDLAVSSRLLKGNNKPSLYYRLHREVKDSLGKSHSSPLHRLVNAGDNPTMLTMSQQIDMQAATAQIRSVVESIEDRWIRFDDLTPENLKTIKVKIQKLAKSVKSLLLESYKREFSEAKRGQAFLNAKKNAHELLREADKLCACLFMPIGASGMKNGEVSQLESLLSNLSINQEDREGSTRLVAWHASSAWSNKETYKKYFSSRDLGDNGDFYIPWDTEVVEAIRDIVSNARHSINEPITNPWRQDDTREAHLWAHLLFEERVILIEFQSPNDKSAEVITKNTRLSHSHTVIRELGGDVRYSDSEDQRLITHVRIPYVHTLSAPSEEASNG